MEYTREFFLFLFFFNEETRFSSRPKDSARREKGKDRSYVWHCEHKEHVACFLDLRNYAQYEKVNNCGMKFSDQLT